MLTQLPFPKGTAPQFAAHVCCGQMAGWIKMQLGTKVALSPGHIMLHGDPAPSKRGTTPIFGHCLLWPNRWMDKDVTWYGGRSRPCPRCVRWGPSSPQGAQTPNFRPMSVVAKWPDGSRCHLVRRQASARCHCVRWGSSSPQRGQHLHFSAHVYCGQTAVWIKMPLGTMIGLSPGNSVKIHNAKNRHLGSITQLCPALSSQN